MSPITGPPSMSEVRKPALLDSYEEDRVGEGIFQPTDGDKILKTNDENVRNVNCDDRVSNRRDECEKLLNKIMHNDDDKLTTTECLSVSMLVGGEHETTDGADIGRNNMTENECMKNDEATRALFGQMNVVMNVTVLRIMMRSVCLNVDTA